MQSIRRIIPIKKILERKSVLLLGPRRTGKSFLIQNQIKPDRYVNLLEADTFRTLAARPETLREMLQDKDKLVAIDEVQKLPLLMDEVHSLIENHKVRFLLTGSSARKLARNHTSLMAGRAKRMHLFPFVSAEIPTRPLSDWVQFGSLPIVLGTPEPWDELKDYAGLYLKEEILAEALVRKIDNFSRFLELAALFNAQLLNFESIGRDAQVPPRTIREYYAVLEDTLIGTALRPIKSSKIRKAIATSKFYFFDLGVVNSITRRKSIVMKTQEFGFLFENFIFLELKSYREYFSDDAKIEFWAMNQETEVDFIVNEEIAIEVKSSQVIYEKHFRGFNKLSESLTLKRKIMVSLEKEKRVSNGVEVYPYREFLKELWAGLIF